jgi:4'-phosphopantetheinyl transferase
MRPSEQIELFYLIPDEASDPALLDRYRALETSEEAAREARFLLEPSQREHLLTRALVRTTLARYAGVGPGALRFLEGPHGRPELAWPELPELRFNLSNTRGLIACAVAFGREIGVDVEWIDRGGATLEIADRFFSPREVSELFALPPERRGDRFFDYWTLKEAYIKARGMGLAIPLDRFSFLLDRPEGIGIEIDRSLGDRADRWWFTQLDLLPRHKTAIAATLEGARTLRILAKRVVPLRDPPV